ncbi:MAG TPA: hypothetical protein VFQ61_08530 [Polyangiaceae bacterium]|nr:hypothetical protein [Polyangiaceae bacterium]
MNTLTDMRVDDLQHQADLGFGYRLAPPDGAVNLDSWKPYIGQFEFDSMHDANTWVWVEGESGADLRPKIGHFETALLLTRAPQIRGAWMLEGPMENGVPRVASFGRRGERTIKEPPYPLTTATLRRAAALANNLTRTFELKALVGRLDRGFVSLVLAMSAEYVEDSVLYLMRALEGMLCADNSREFKARAAAILRDGSAELLDELYVVRNKFTHAEPVSKAFPAGMTEAQMTARCRQLQAFLYHFATRAYREVLSRPELMNRLTQPGVGAYWDKVIEGTETLSFVVVVPDDVWNFEHDDHGTHYLMRHEAVIAELARDASTGA